LTPAPTTSFAAPAVAHAAPPLAAGRISTQPSTRAAPAHGSERSSPAAAREQLLRAPLGGSPTAARARGSCPRRLAELSRNLAFYQDRSTKWIARANQKARFHGQDLFTSGSNPLFSCLIFLIHSLAMQLEVKRRMGRGNKKLIYVCLLSFSNAAA